MTMRAPVALVTGGRRGIIATDMTAPAKERCVAPIPEGITPVRRWGLPEDIGKTVTAGAGRLLPFNTGAAFHADGGLHLKIL